MQDKLTTFLIVLNIVLAMVIVNLSIDIVDAYVHNRKYDPVRIQAEVQKELALACARQRKELLDQGWMLDPRPELDELIAQMERENAEWNETIEYLTEGGD